MNKTNTLDLKNFKCIRCLACCRQPGYVRLHPKESDAIAQFLDLDVHTFIETYTRLTRDRQCLSLVEKPGGACIFLTDKGCTIEVVKPLQCKNFPHKWKFSDFEHVCGWAKEMKKRKF